MFLGPSGPSRPGATPYGDGVPLSGSVALTIVGEYLLSHARRVLAVMRDAEDMVASLRGLQGGKLDVGVAPTPNGFAADPFKRMLRYDASVVSRLVLR